MGPIADQGIAESNQAGHMARADVPDDGVIDLAIFVDDEVAQCDHPLPRDLWVQRTELIRESAAGFPDDHEFVEYGGLQELAAQELLPGSRPFELQEIATCEKDVDQNAEVTIHRPGWPRSGCDAGDRGCGFVPRAGDPGRPPGDRRVGPAP